MCNPFEITTDNNVLKISISISDIARMFEHCPLFTDKHTSIANAHDFLEELAYELHDETHDGTTKLHNLFDVIFMSIVEKKRACVNVVEFQR